MEEAAEDLVAHLAGVAGLSAVLVDLVAMRVVVDMDLRHSCLVEGTFHQPNTLTHFLLKQIRYRGGYRGRGRGYNPY